MKEWIEYIKSKKNEAIVLMRLLLIAALIFNLVTVFEIKRQRYFYQESFDLNSVPDGHVVWIYPKNKLQSPMQPDSLLKKAFLDSIGRVPLNYNVDVWIVAIHNSYDEIVKIEVPDYAIGYFKMNHRFVKPQKTDATRKFD